MSAPQLDPKQRVAIITGCSEPTSLGAAFARELLQRKWTVFATARDVSTLEYLEDAGCQVLALDVTSDESVSLAAQHISTLTGGRVDLLINNAGAIGMAPVTLTDPAKLAAMHDLHVLGPLRMTQAFFPYMSATATASSRAKIVNIGSVISHGFPWYAAYATTKASTQILSDVMRRELRPFNIDVITVELGITQTALYSPTKAFDLTLDGGEPFFNADAAITKSTKDFAKSGQSAPTPAMVARSLTDAVEQRHSPRKMYLGQNSFLFRWIVPYLPISMGDALFSKLMNVSIAGA